MKLSDKVFGPLDLRVIDVVVIAAIVGLFAGIRTIDNPGGEQNHKARLGVTLGDLRSISNATNSYHLRFESYPDSLSELVPDFLESLPQDPWGQPYVFIEPGKCRAFDVYSRGPDGKVNADDVGDDIGTWESC